MAARKPVLSPTRICTWLECRRRYWYIYEKKLPRYFGARASFSFGNSLHRALQEYHRAGGPEAQDAGALVAQLERSWVAAGYDSAEAEQARLSQGREVLTAYHEGGAGQEGETLFTEKVLRSDMGEYVLTGRVDRLDRLPGGELEVIDYKSGERLPSAAEVAEDLPMALYQLLCARQFQCPRVKASIYHLRTHRKVSVVRSETELRPVAAGVDGIFAEIQEEKEFARLAGDHCRGCDFHRRCWGRPAALGTS
ncbi:MAG: PD-(D/E)XK nuclease family protein [Armatimonadetes bacterium]|nr:PD-(D/E)XK nuclease family protein [Armatimonadota bacterium]